jgi:hypothetical protein
MRCARWAFVFVFLGLVAACGPTNGQTPPAGESVASSTTPAQTTETQLAPSEQTVVATLTLQDDGAGGCKKAADGLGPIYVKRGRTVQWFIVNNCKDPVDIQVKDFAIKLPAPNNPQYSPFREEPGSCHAEPGRVCTPVITATVGNKSPNGGRGVWVFTYRIVRIVNGEEINIDPEIVIEWF